MMPTTPEAAAAMLRDAQLRVTRPRVAVIQHLGGAAHTNADDVATAVRVHLGKVSRQAIYDVLHALKRAGIVRCIEPAGSPALYELHTGDNHHHMVCRKCGALADVDCATQQAPCLQPSHTRGFEIDEAEVVFWGLCPQCTGAPTASPAPAP